MALFSDTSPVGGDFDNDLLGKICQILNGQGTGSGGTQSVVTGAAADNAVKSGNPVYVAGGAVTGSTYSPAYAVGDAAQFAIDKDSGGLLCHIRTLTTTDVVTNVPKGAANIASGQVTATTSAATLIAVRSTRRSAVVRNLDSVITVYIGPATVTSGNGMPLRAGESMPIDSTALIQVIAASGTPSVAYIENYD